MSKTSLILLLALTAHASQIFSITATDGPFPAVVNSQVLLYDTEYLTVTVAPDPELEQTINPLVDAVIAYTVAWNEVTVDDCPPISPVPCGGTADYQITGLNLDSGASGGYGGLSNQAPWDMQSVGEPSGLLYLEAGTYTLQAYAETMVEG